MSAEAPEPRPVKRYSHPQGATITVFDDGSLEKRNKAGKRSNTSATPAALEAGHGRWVEVPL